MFFARRRSPRTLLLQQGGSGGITALYYPPIGADAELEYLPKEGILLSTPLSEHSLLGAAHVALERGHATTMPTPKRDEEREERISMEIIVDCYNETEAWSGWWCYLK
jgi:hypothetical protein